MLNTEMYIGNRCGIKLKNDSSAKVSVVVAMDRVCGIRDDIGGGGMVCLPNVG